MAKGNPTSLLFISEKKKDNTLSKPYLEHYSSGLKSITSRSKDLVGVFSQF